NAGDTSKTITVNVVADTTVEPNETFTVGLANATGATINQQQVSATGTIQNDDQVQQPVLAISALSADKAEGSDGGTTPFTFTVTHTGDTSGTSSVFWQVSSTSNPTVDANDFSGPISGTLTW